MFTEVNRKRRGHAFLPPKTVLAKIPKLYETEATATADKVVWLHYFSPAGDWWITELDQEEMVAFGWVKLAGYPDGEWGYMSLEEMESVYVPPWVIVERDMWWTPVKFSEVKA